MYGYSAVDGMSLNVGLGSECPEFDECGNYLHSTSTPWVDECPYHGRFRGWVTADLGWTYEALDL